MNRLRTRLAVSLPIIGLLAILSGCAEETDTAIRPLIGDVPNNYVVNSQVVSDVQGNLAAIARIIAQDAPSEAFSDVSLDDVNERVLDTTIIEPWRNVNEYAGGTEAAGWLATEKRAVLVSSSANGTCWAVQMTGRPAEPDIRFAAMFDPQCNAKKVARTDTLTWTKQWPEEPTPNPATAPTSPPTSGSGPAPRATEGPAGPSAGPSPGAS